MFGSDDRAPWQQVGYCYEILPPSRDASYDNPPLNLPKPLPPHQHEHGYDPRCGLCEHLQQLAQERGR